MDEKEFADAEGDAWIARIISGGRSSPYLNERVHRPIVQFDRSDRSAPARYSMLPRGLPDSVDALGDDDLRDLLAKSTTH